MAKFFYLSIKDTNYNLNFIYALDKNNNFLNVFNLFDFWQKNKL